MATQIYKPTASDKINPRMAAATAANLAARAVRAGTKLRKHYLNLTKANNIFLAIYVHYDLEAEYGATQKMFLKALIDVEARKNRAWLNDDLNAVDLAVTAYTDLLKSLTDEQFEEIMKFVDLNATSNKHLVYSKK
jgi:hypothetical protein